MKMMVKMFPSKMFKSPSIKILLANMSCFKHNFTLSIDLVVNNSFLHFITLLYNDTDTTDCAIFGIKCKH